MDGVLIDGFRPDSLNYTIVLPSVGAKLAEPLMPSVTYVLGQEGQTVNVTTGTLNDKATQLTVHAPKGTAITSYEVMITSEPSHCTELSGIILNGAAIEDFEPGRHFYSLSLKTSNITVDYTSDDRFQTVTIEPTELEKDSKYRYILHVTAEDGVTTADYQVNIYVENKSNDATLANILLDGKKFVDFERALNEDLAFDPGQNSYVINLPSGTTVLPEVSAQLKMDGQTVVIDRQDNSVLLTVHAMDNSTNQYVLHFDTQHH